MRKIIIVSRLVLGLLTALTGANIGFAQSKAGGTDKPANNMEIVHEKLKADKKLIVAKYMELTESEAKTFWPEEPRSKRADSPSCLRAVRIARS